MRTLALVVLVLGCGGGGAERSERSSPSPSNGSATTAQESGGPGCEDAVRAAATHVAELAVPAKMADAVADCIRDSWPDDTRRCVAVVKDEPDMVACMLRFRQQQDLRRAPADQRLAVTGIEPDRGDVAGGTYVRIAGQRFTVDGPRAVKVYFGDREAIVDRFTSDSELIVEAPGGKAGEVADVVVVFEPGGQVRLPRAFTFVERR